eukprot:Opistho-2@18964
MRCQRRKLQLRAQSHCPTLNSAAYEVTAHRTLIRPGRLVLFDAQPTRACKGKGRECARPCYGMGRSTPPRRCVFIFTRSRKQTTVTTSISVADIPKSNAKSPRQSPRCTYLAPLCSTGVGCAATESRDRVFNEVPAMVSPTRQQSPDRSERIRDPNVFGGPFQLDPNMPPPPAVFYYVQHGGGRMHTAVEQGGNNYGYVSQKAQVVPQAPSTSTRRAKERDRDLHLPLMATTPSHVAHGGSRRPAYQPPPSSEHSVVTAWGNPVSPPMHMARMG